MRFLFLLVHQGCVYKLHGLLSFVNLRMIRLDREAQQITGDGGKEEDDAVAAAAVVFLASTADFAAVAAAVQAAEFTAAVAAVSAACPAASTRAFIHSIKNLIRSYVH